MTITYKRNTSPLVTVRQFVAMDRYREVFSESILRSLIAGGRPHLNARGQIVSGNGILESGAIFRPNRRILIDVEAFDLWLMSKLPTME